MVRMQTKRSDTGRPTVQFEVQPIRQPFSTLSSRATGPTCIDIVFEVQDLERPLGVVKVREIIEAIEDEGWFQVRHTGSHRQFHHPTHRSCVTVAGHPSRDLPEWIVNSIMKQAGIGRRKK